MHHGYVCPKLPATRVEGKRLERSERAHEGRNDKERIPLEIGGRSAPRNAKRSSDPCPCNNKTNECQMARSRKTNERKVK